MKSKRCGICKEAIPLGDEYKHIDCMGQEFYNGVRLELNRDE